MSEAIAIERIEIDAASLRAATPLQSTEWRLLLDELRRGGLQGEDGVNALVIERAGAFARVRLESASGVVRAVDLGTQTLLSLFDEYAGIVRQMMDGSMPLPRLEALDMAKKVVHDRAARALRVLLPEVIAELEGMRRLFSLCVAMRIDPSAMGQARRHG